MTMKRLIAMLCMGMVVAGCYPPQVQYPYTQLVHTRRNDLHDHLLLLLPEEQRNEPAAQEEARWLADTAYKASAGIARINASHFPGWIGNALVNMRLQDRGLCWQYQHDLYRELRRRRLSYFRLGCCVRDRSERSEHNCLYIAAANGEWPDAWMLDAWMYNGRLKVDYGKDLDLKRWEDRPYVVDLLKNFYFEGHRYPIEHWYIVRGKNGRYSEYRSENAWQAPQFNRMYENIQKGYREHPGSPVNY